MLVAPNDLPFTKAELRDTLFTFDKKEEPGPDQVDFNFLREIDQTLFMHQIFYTSPAYRGS